MPLFSGDLETSQSGEGNFSYSNRQPVPLLTTVLLNRICSVFQGCQRGMAVISLICKTLKTDSNPGTLWSTFVAQTIRLSRFPELTSVYLLKPLTTGAATATDHACLLSSSPVWSPLIVLICPRRLSICQSTLPSKPSRRCFSTQGK